MFDNKAQSALEYLMTYGWALIVIAIVIAVLIFVVGGATGGVNCSSTSAFNVVAAPIASGPGGAQMTLQNITGQAITITGITGKAPFGTTVDLATNVANVTDRSDWDYNAIADTGSLLKNGSFNITGIEGPAAGSFQDGGYTIDYTTSTGLSASSTISCSGTVQ